MDLESCMLIGSYESSPDYTKKYRLTASPWVVFRGTV